MNPLVPVLDTAPSWLSALYRASWQGAVGIAIVWCLCRWARRLPPGLRCWLWRLVFIKMLVLLLWPGTFDLPWLPPRADAPPLLFPTTVAPAATPPAHTAARPVDGPPGHPGRPLPGPAGATASGYGLGARSIARVVCCAWLLGVLAVMVLLTQRARAARRWRRDCALVKDPHVLSMCESLSAELGVYQPPVLFSSEACDGPVVFGALRTAIVLPAGLLNTPDPRQLRLILRHELAHVRRGDLAWNWLATAIWGLFFFHPLVWIALRELRLHQEFACDACAVADRDASVADYGNLLLELAGRPRGPSSLLVTVGVVESFEFLKRRLTAMLESHSPRAWTRPAAAALVPLALVAVLPWRLVARSPETQLVTSRPSPARCREAAEAGRYRVDLGSIRRIEGTQLALVATGIPAGLGVPQPASPDPGSEAGADGTSRASASSHYRVVAIPGAAQASAQAEVFAEAGPAAQAAPNLVVDVRVHDIADDRAVLRCALIGEARASDDRGHHTPSPALPPDLRLQVSGVDYPQDGGASVHLALPDKTAHRLHALDGALLVVRLARETVAFQASTMDRPRDRRLPGMICRMGAPRHDQQGIAVEITLLADPDGSVEPAPLTPDAIELTLADTAGRVHTPRAQGLGGPGSAGPAGAEQPDTADRATRVLAICGARFAPLPTGVTIDRITCTITTAGSPRVVPFAFKDLQLP